MIHALKKKKSQISLGTACHHLPQGAEAHISMLGAPGNLPLNKPFARISSRVTSSRLSSHWLPFLPNNPCGPAVEHWEVLAQLRLELRSSHSKVQTCLY